MLLRTRRLPLSMMSPQTLYPVAEEYQVVMDDQAPEIEWASASQSITFQLQPTYDAQGRVTAVACLRNLVPVYTHVFQVMDAYATDAEGLWLFPCGGYYTEQCALKDVEQCFMSFDGAEYVPKSTWLSYHHLDMIFATQGVDSLETAMCGGMMQADDLVSYSAQKTGHTMTVLFREPLP